jgi:hypothetical protein
VNISGDPIKIPLVIFPIIKELISSLASIGYFIDNFILLSSFFSHLPLTSIILKLDILHQYILFRIRTSMFRFRLFGLYLLLFVYLILLSEKRISDWVGDNA